MELFFSLGKHLFGDSEAVFSGGSRVGLPLHGLGLCRCPRAGPAGDGDGDGGEHRIRKASSRCKEGTQQGQSGRRLQAQGRQMIQPTLVWQRHPCSRDPGAL